MWDVAYKPEVVILNIQLIKLCHIFPQKYYSQFTDYAVIQKHCYSSYQKYNTILQNLHMLYQLLSSYCTWTIKTWKVTEMAGFLHLSSDICGCLYSSSLVALFVPMFMNITSASILLKKEVNGRSCDFSNIKRSASYRTFAEKISLRL